MKMLSALILCLTLMLTALINSAPPKAWAVKDTIIAVVNDDVITFSDLREYLESLYIQFKIEGRPMAEIQRIMQEMEATGIQKLIEDKLILTEANRIGLEVRKKAVDQRLDEIKSKYESEQAFLDALLSDGASITDLKNKILDQLRMQYLIETEVRDKIFVNPGEVTDYYHHHMKKFVKPEQVKCDSIFIGFGDDPQQARLKAKKAQKALLEGDSFAEAAKEYSEAPSIGMMERGQMIKDIEDQVFRLKEGELSNPLEVESGIYIIRVLKHIPSETAGLEEVKDQISNLIFAKKFKEKFQAWLQKLKDKAFIEIKD